MWILLSKLKEIAVSAISRTEDINDAIDVIVDYRVGINPFNVNKCNVTAGYVVAPWCCRGKILICALQLSLQGYVPHSKTLETLNRSFSCIVSSISESNPCTRRKFLYVLLSFQNLAVDFVKFSKAREDFFIGCFSCCPKSLSFPKFGGAGGRCSEVPAYSPISWGTKVEW